MVVRSNFDAKLTNLKDKLIKMAELSMKTIEDAIDALVNQDLEKAEKIIKDDIIINKLEQEINEDAITLIAIESPIATDLRRIMVAISTSSDFERIGDLSVNIAKSTLIIGSKPFIKPIVDIPRMASMVQSMLSEMLEAFISEDTVKAKEIAEKDDAVDAIYGEIMKELLELMSKNPETIDQATQLAFISRNLERVGDHVTNIMEDIIYKVKGYRYELNN